MGVQDLYKGTMTTDLSDYNKWLSEIRTIGTNILRVEVFFAVEISKWLKEIVDKDRNDFKKENISIE